MANDQYLRSLERYRSLNNKPSSAFSASDDEKVAIAETKYLRAKSERRSAFDTLTKIMGGVTNPLKTANDFLFDDSAKEDAQAAAKYALGSPVAQKLFDGLDTPRAAVVSGLNEGIKALNRYVLHNDAIHGVEGGFFDNMWGNISTGKMLTGISDDNLVSNFAKEHPTVFGLGTLAVDASLDPLNKLHLKVGKAASTEALAAKYVDDVVGDLSSSASKATIFAENLDQAAKQAAAGTGKPAANYINAKAVQEAAAIKTGADLSSVVSQRVRDMAQEGKYIALKFGDHELGRSRLAYRPVELAKRTLAESFLGSTFSRKIELGVSDELYTAQRAKANYNMFKYEEQGKALRDFFGSITDDEKIKLAKAREAGIVPNITLSDGRTMKEVLSEVDKYYTDMWNAEVAAGFHSGKTYDPKYIGVRPTTLNAERRAAARDLRTIAEQEGAGGKPLKRIDDLIYARLGKHYADMNDAAFYQEAANLYGRRLDDPLTGMSVGKVGDYSAKQRQRIYTEAMKDAGYKKVTGEAAKYIDPEIHLPENVLDSLNKIGKKLKAGQESGTIVNYIDAATKQWKFLATAINPGHHTRNFVSDVLLAFYDDVDTTSFAKTAKEMARGYKGSTKVGRLDVSWSTIDDLFNETGARNGFTAAEIGTRKSTIANTARKVSDVREEFVRKAHFYDSLLKEGKDVTDLKELRAAAERARDRVWTFHFDYGDFSSTERSLKKVIPFYSWLRKNTELQVVSLLTRPGKLNMYPRALTAIETLMGQDPGEKSRIQEYMPEWLTDMMPMQVSGGDNPIFATQSLPGLDPLKYFGDFDKGIGPGLQGFGKEFLSSVHPLAKLPVELTTGRSILTGAEVDLGDIMINQLPIPRVINQTQQKVGEDAQDKWLPILNWLTGAGLQQLTDKRKVQGLQDHTRRDQEYNRKQKQKILKEMYPEMP